MPSFPFIQQSYVFLENQPCLRDCALCWEEKEQDTVLVLQDLLIFCGGGGLLGLVRVGFPEEEATIAKIILTGVSQARSQESEGKQMCRGPDVRGACLRGKEEEKERESRGHEEVGKELALNKDAK